VEEAAMMETEKRPHHSKLPAALPKAAKLPFFVRFCKKNLTFGVTSRVKSGRSDTVFFVIF
jgi:hypothetical protein